MAKKRSKLSKKNSLKDKIKRPGAFRKKAKAAGMSTDEYAEKALGKGSKADARTKRQAAMAKAFKSMRSKK